MLKPICVQCERFYRPFKNGFYFVEGMPAPGVERAIPGTSHPDHWKPYKLWCGDLYRCEGCGAQAIVGVGFQPLAVKHQDNFKRDIEAFGAELLVKDC